LGRKIVPESDIPLGLGSNLQLEDTEYSTRTEGEERKQRRVKQGEEPRWLTVPSR